MDIDGTLVLGDQLIDGTRELIEEIHRQHGICCYLPTIHPEAWQNMWISF